MEVAQVTLPASTNHVGLVGGAGGEGNCICWTQTSSFAFFLLLLCMFLLLSNFALN